MFVWSGLTAPVGYRHVLSLQTVDRHRQYACPRGIETVFLKTQKRRFLKQFFIPKQGSDSVLLWSRDCSVRRWLVSMRSVSGSLIDEWKRGECLLLDFVGNCPYWQISISWWRVGTCKISGNICLHLPGNFFENSSELPGKFYSKHRPGEVYFQTPENVSRNCSVIHCCKFSKSHSANSKDQWGPR